uniref:Retrovirus-related Pol polyprotein from transposon TNT 1-94 n=1 Tax=Tanacetum cinerariifolium TaxID=118510 RepID=A0A6L2MXU4_TANCI|nr:hypothetical protein [Tanacetum cinerariifolium]
MLEKGSCVSWTIRFRRYIDRNKDPRKFIKHSIDIGPYQFKTILDTKNTQENIETEDHLTSDDLKQYEAEIEAMNLILLSIPNDIYNFVDACENAKDMWDLCREQMLLAKKDEAGIILINEHDVFLLADASEVNEFEELNATFNKHEDEYLDDIIDLKGKFKANETWLSI